MDEADNDTESADEPFVDWDFIRLNHNEAGHAILTLHGQSPHPVQAYLSSAPIGIVADGFHQVGVRAHSQPIVPEHVARWTITYHHIDELAGTDGVEIVGATKRKRYTLDELHDR